MTILYILLGWFALDILFCWGWYRWQNYLDGQYHDEAVELGLRAEEMRREAEKSLKQTATIHNIRIREHA